MTNAALLQNEGESLVSINCREMIETDENGIAIVKHKISKPVFLYKQSTGEKITEYQIEENRIITNLNFTDLLIDYYYDYKNGFEILSFGNSLTNGYFSLEGKTRVKDDITGQVKTGIIKIPKLKLLSNLSMRLGNDAIPQVGRLDAVAVPTGPKG